MKEVKKHGHVESWIAALSAKYEGKGTPYNLQEFDQLLGNWAVCERQSTKSARMLT